MHEERKHKLLHRLDNYCHGVKKVPEFRVVGRLTRVVGMTLEAVGFAAPIGSKCKIYSGQHAIEAEVIGFANDVIYLVSTESTRGITTGAKVMPIGSVADVPVGEALLGRIIDGAGNPLDHQQALKATDYYPLEGKHINPLDRKKISEPLDVGIRSINALLSIGCGQRIGLFAGSGVGKSVLMGMMTRYTSADVIVVGLIGERGREVKEFIENSLGESLARSVVVAAPADVSPLMRLHGAKVATCIAEYFRDQGLNVLLLVDSLTRFAQAQRQLALSIGEPPATKGYPPSVFAKLSNLVERAGNAIEGKGSITALYTVLAEGDDQQDPIADAARSILDGHIVMSRTLADSGHYPAIDIESSISRVMTEIVALPHWQLAQQYKHYYSLYQQNSDLISVGAYQAGTNKELDAAVAMFPKLKQFLKQDMHERFSFNDSLQQLSGLFQ
jgi:flagellum-specific ATP synthase